MGLRRPRVGPAGPTLGLCEQGGTSTGPTQGLRRLRIGPAHVHFGICIIPGLQLHRSSLGPAPQVVPWLAHVQLWTCAGPTMDLRRSTGICAGHVCTCAASTWADAEASLNWCLSSLELRMSRLNLHRSSQARCRSNSGFVQVQAWTSAVPGWICVGPRLHLFRKCPGPARDRAGRLQLVQAWTCAASGFDNGRYSSRTACVVFQCTRCVSSDAFDGFGDTLPC